MHNIKTNFGRFYRICKEFFEDEDDKIGNLHFYPKMPVMADLEVIALSCTMEALGIDSEHLLWSKIRKDYPSMFVNLICRTRFNRRRRRLQPYIVRVQDKVSARLEDQSQTMVIDSIPVVKMARERFRINQHDYKKHPKKYKSKRQMVETFFAQMCDHLNLKRNYAKSYNGLLTRLTWKLSSMSILHWINHLNGKN